MLCNHFIANSYRR